MSRSPELGFGDVRPCGSSRWWRRLADAAGIAVLHTVPRVLVFIALAGWLDTFVGLLRSLVATNAPRV